MRLISILLISFGAVSAQANTDYTCLNSCTQQGFMYGYCKNKCSYGDNTNSFSGYQPAKQTDYMCVSRCTQQGMIYGFCKEKCSY